MMSTYYYANLIIGIRLLALNPKTFSIPGTVTKYDPDTGKPYEKKTEEFFTRFGETDLPGTLDEALRYFNEDYKTEFEEEMGENPLGKNIPGLFRTHDYSKSIEDMYLGYFICAVSESNSVKSVDEEQFDLLKSKLERWLKEKFGYTDGVYTWLIMEVSA